MGFGYIIKCGAPVPRDVCPFANPDCAYNKDMKPSPPKIGAVITQKDSDTVFQFDGDKWQELKREEIKNARHRLFSALDDLDEEVGEVVNAGSRTLRKQAVIDVVNALYPKTEQNEL